MCKRILRMIEPIRFESNIAAKRLRMCEFVAVTVCL